MEFLQSDRDILRKLAEEYAAVAALPVQKETAAEWARLNTLQPGRPLVWINELPWHEMNVNDELTLCCKDAFLKQVELELRFTLYQWKHIPANMVVEPKYLCQTVVYDTGFGIAEQSEIKKQDAEGVPSRHFHAQIRSEKDVERIKMPEVTVDHELTGKRFTMLCDIFGDILPVEKYGTGFQWFAPWDALVTWYGVQEALTDLALRPELVHAAIERLVTAYLHRLDQHEKLNLLALNNGNFRIGSGGLGYTDELPAKGFNPNKVRTIDQWGNATAQIFSEVSSAMHEEFALQYERRWLDRFGLTYYGCCEPLHKKMEILKKISNLRKISVSPKADKVKSAEEIGTNYVFSLKPNPAILATDRWNPEKARKELREDLEKAKGCVVEIIMKDVSTIRHEPERIWEWAKLAVQTAEEFS